MRKHRVLDWRFMFGLLLLSSTLSAAPVEYTGSSYVTGIDGIKRCIRVSMFLDDAMVESPGVPPLYANIHQAVGYFPIYTYLVEVSGVGVYAGANGRLDIWLNQSSGSQHFYTEELEILQYHNLMEFYNGAGGKYDWAPWLGSGASYELAPELVITRLNITPGYSFDLGNEIHLYPVPCKCRCKHQVKSLDSGSFRVRPCSCGCKPTK
jgi:hypothetical protein